MKRASRTRTAKIVTALAILGAASLLTGCGSNSSSVPPGTNTGYLPGYPGYPGAPGSNGACVPLVTGGYNYAGAQAPLGFQANGMYFDGRVLRAGFVPGYNQTFGQVAITQGGQGGPYTRSGVDGTLSMNITTGQAGYNPYQPTPAYNPYQPMPGASAATTANSTGMIQISSATMQDILMNFGGGYNTYQPTYNPYNPGYMPQPGYPQQPQVCVSGIAVDLQWSPQANMLYGGYVYLYMNNTQHGYKLFF